MDAKNLENLEYLEYSRDFSEHGKLGESSGNSVQQQEKIVTQYFFVRYSHLILGKTTILDVK